MVIGNSFARSTAPDTGRTTVQLTVGDAFCYPLYYFIPSLTSGAETLIYHRAEEGQVQLHALDLSSGQSRQLTHASSPDTICTHWSNIAAKVKTSGSPSAGTGRRSVAARSRTSTLS